MISIKRELSLLRMKIHRYFFYKYWEYRDLKTEWQPRSLFDYILLFFLAVCIIILIAIPIYMVYINMEYKEKMKQYNQPSKEITQPKDLYYYDIHKYDEIR